MVCCVPPARRAAVTWETHKLAHAGAKRTLQWLQLTWYWPEKLSYYYLLKPELTTA